MNILTRLSIRNFKLNKKRTISTIIGIILSVALICAVAGMGKSFQETLVQNSINKSGYWHAKIDNVPENEIKSIKNNRDIKSTIEVKVCGYARLENSENEYKPYLRLFSMGENEFENLHFRIIEGRFPQNSNEVIISKAIATNGNVKYNIGDIIDISVGERKITDEDEQEKNIYKLEKIVNSQEYKLKVVGVIERPDTTFEKYSEPGYTIISTGIEQGNTNIYISLKNPRNYEEALTKLFNVKDYKEVLLKGDNIKFDYTLNNELLRWEAFEFSNSTIDMLYAVITVVIIIIIITSVFCIRNSFAIATTEKIKMYSMLASVGATKKQIRKNVINEGLLLGIIGIPLGIVSGFFAVFVLIKIVNSILGEYLLANIDGIVFKVSILPIILSVILGILTIYLSALSSARKASKVSPIEGLRSSNSIKLNSKKLKVPNIISKIFKTGGELAYKNLKRSKKKYRTTVVSIAVSIFIFITMNAFITNMFDLTGDYYTDYNYNMELNLGTVTAEEIKQIVTQDNIERYTILYNQSDGVLKIKDLSKINKKEGNLIEEVYYDEETGKTTKTGEVYLGLIIMGLGQKDFENYAKKIGAKYDEVKDKGILCDEISYVEDEKSMISRRYTYNKGDIIKGTVEDSEQKEQDVEIKVGTISNTKPDGIEKSNYTGGYLIVNIDEYKDLNFKPYIITIQSNNADQLEKDIEKLNLKLNIYNIEASAKEERGMILVVKIFLYGFITVITLIGVTNIFNTITSNMELRQKEFAMLKSIGMTKKEFNRMINLETIFYGTKSWIYGTIAGLLGTILMYKAFSIKIEKGIYIPINAIIMSAIFVFIFVFIIMKYSINKINKQNTIETIRNENV